MFFRPGNGVMVRTRFAPSPTGYLHIGGVRTALFNWLFARKHGGQFILRIDDTDQQRNVAEALQPILDGFRWLGIDWDEGAEVGGPHGPYYQSQRQDRYRAAVQTLLERGHAYWDYATSDEVKAERETAEKAKQSYVSSRRWMARTPEERAKFEAEGRTHSVRLLMPREGFCEFNDHIRGAMKVAWASEQDHVVQRADGTCLYNLANVVDDRDMKITHVIRAEEHLSNTPRQIFIARGLGYELPEYAHVPFVAEPGSKNKLSKRKIGQYLKNPDFSRVYERAVSLTDTLGLAMAATIRRVVQENEDWDQFSADRRADLVRGTIDSLYPSSELTPGRKRLVAALAESCMDYLSAPSYLDVFEHGRQIKDRLKSQMPPERFNPVMIDFYKEVGYLPEAILNYLVLLGWSLDDKTEDFTRRQMVDLFSLERVNKAPASFDPKKLFAFQERYMQRLTVDEKIQLTEPFLKNVGLQFDLQKLRQIVHAAGDRIKVSGDILDYLDIFRPGEQVDYDETAFEKYIRKPLEAVGLLRKVRERLATAEPFDGPTLELLVQDFVQAEGIKMNQIIHALRVAVTGKAVGFGLYESLAIQGRESCLARIDRALEKSTAK